MEERSTCTAKKKGPVPYLMYRGSRSNIIYFLGFMVPTGTIRYPAPMKSREAMPCVHNTSHRLPRSVHLMHRCPHSHSQRFALCVFLSYLDSSEMDMQEQAPKRCRSETKQRVANHFKNVSSSAGYCSGTCLHCGYVAKHCRSS